MGLQVFKGGGYSFMFSGSVWRLPGVGDFVFNTEIPKGEVSLAFLALK